MTIQDSLTKILESRDDLASAFYPIFFERHPEAKPYFKDVNLRHQTVLLTMGLMVVVRHFTHGQMATELYLEYLGHKHHMRSVPEELYPKWVDCLLAALAKFHGKDWDGPLDQDWRAALNKATTLMLAGYKEPQHV